jgi:hypothetical protein
MTTESPSSSSSSSPSPSAALKPIVTDLRAREASLTRIAIQAVALLRAQGDPLQPDGIWLTEHDQAILQEVQDAELSQVAGKPWRWTKVSHNVGAGRPACDDG